MDADRGVEVRICCPHDRGHRPAGRHPGHVHPAGVDVVLAKDLAGDTGDKRRLAAPTSRWTTS
jgi:hypothetical protein